jgi:hypothetical protein
MRVGQIRIRERKFVVPGDEGTYSRIVLGTSLLVVFRCLKTCTKLPDVSAVEMEGIMKEFVPFHREIGLSTILHALGVWDISSCADNRYFTPPDNLRDGEDRTVDVGLGVPVARNQEHILTDMDARFVDAE